MNIRRCPACGYQYSLKEHFTGIFGLSAWTQWRCKGCASTITYRFGRRLLLAVIHVTLSALLFALKDHFAFTLLWNILGLLLLIIVTMYIFSLDAYKKV